MLKIKSTTALESSKTDSGPELVNLMNNLTSTII